MQAQEMTAKIANGQGFIAALDQSGGSTPKALRGYGVDESEWSGDEEMFAKIHEMRCRIVTSPSFNGDKVSEVSGQLTLLGKTQPVTLKANAFNCYDSPMLKREVCGGDFETTIDRTAFGVNYGVDWGFPKNVRLVLQVEAVKQ